MNTINHLSQNGLKGGTLLFHYARLIELLYCLEKAKKLLEDERICGGDIRTTADPSNREGVGVIEAPRGNADPSLPGGQIRYS